MAMGIIAFLLLQSLHGDYIVFLIIIRSVPIDANIFLLFHNVLSEIWTGLISVLLFYTHNQTSISYDDSPFFLIQYRFFC